MARGSTKTASPHITMWAVIRPVQVVAEDTFIRTVRRRRQIETFLLTYLLIHSQLRKNGAVQGGAFSNLQSF